MRGRHLIVTFGRKLTEYGEMDERFKNQVECAVRLYEPGDWFFITGGETRKGFGAESLKAAEMLHCPLKKKTRYESRSRTMVQNIQFTRAYLEDCLKDCSMTIDDFEKVVFVGGTEAHLLRVKWVCERYWPEVISRAQFLTTYESEGFVEKLKEKLIFWLTRFDPDERRVFPILIKVLRNA